MNIPTKLSLVDRYASLLKMIAIGILILLFMIPTSMIKDLIQEREQNQNEIINQVAVTWGGQQYIGGPIISVPYLAKVEDDNKRFKMVKLYLHIMPEQLNVQGDLQSKPLKRSIYEVAVYKGDLKINGTFKIDPYELDQMNSADLLWNEAVLWMEISDLRGVKEELKINWNNTPLYFRPGLKTKSLAESGVSVPLNLEQIATTKEFKFAMNMKLNGSQTLQFYPIGKTTNVKLTSNWDSPNFNGAFSPENRKLSKNKSGFEADWKVLHLNRNFSQVFKENEQQYSNYAFGVELHQTVDQYQKSMRSVKYAVMFITLTFLVFFFTEIINQKAIHPIQYILIGLALVVFFTLLISLAEHIGFNSSFILAASAVVTLITFYTHAVLKSAKLTAIMASVLIVLYSFIYTIIQLEDFALLFGSIGLFLFLAVMMIASRKIDWYQMVKKEEN